MFDEKARREYAKNLLQLIHEFRIIFPASELLVVIGEKRKMGS